MQSQARETKVATTAQKPPPPPPSLTNFLEPDSQRPIAKMCRRRKCTSSGPQLGSGWRASAEIETEMGTSSTEMETESRRRADAVPAHLSSTQESDIIGGAVNSGVFPTLSCPRSLDPQQVTSPSTTAHPKPPCVGFGVRVGVRVVEGVSKAKLPRRAPAQMVKAQRSSLSTSTGARSLPRLPCRASSMAPRARLTSACRGTSLARVSSSPWYTACPPNRQAPRTSDLEQACVLVLCARGCRWP